MAPLAVRAAHSSTSTRHRRALQFLLSTLTEAGRMGFVVKEQSTEATSLHTLFVTPPRCP